MSPIYTPGKVVLRKTWQPMDADAAAYITAVETADGQALEEKVKIAIDNFVLGCKADGIWSAIKASCILAGARTLSGALKPLVGTAPTPYFFVEGDYNRKTGLVGNGTSKYLDSNRNNNADPQNSRHMSVYASTAATSGASDYPGYIGFDSVGADKSGRTHIGRLNSNSTTLYIRGCSSAPSTEFDSYANAGASTGLIGLSRSASADFSARAGGASNSFTRTSSAPASGNVNVFYLGSTATHANARLAFYSIGESLDLARLDARVTDLINAFGAAIP